MSSQRDWSTLATVIIAALLIGVLVAYTYSNTSSKLGSLSSEDSSLGGQIASLGQQNSNLNQEVSSLELRTVQVVTVSNTVYSVVPSFTTQASTSVTTTVSYSTVTTVTTAYPPSTSNLALTFVSGNATEDYPSCGTWSVQVDVTYELHQEIGSNIVQWAVFPSGTLMQPSSQDAFYSGAYVTVFSTYSGSCGTCGCGAISSVSAFISLSTNAQISPTTGFIVSQQ